MARILVVEDNEMNRDLICRQLRRKGFELVTATDGAAAVEQAAAELPDLILMDMGLPILSGYEATRIVRGNQATQRIPIIGLSAHAMTGDAEKALAAGCDDYATKPIEWPVLLSKIDALLERARRPAAEDVEVGSPGEVDAATAGLRVLLGDPDSLNRKVLQQRLEELGHQGTAVSTEEELLAKAGDGWDAILLSIHLAQPDSRELVRRLALDERLKSTPILALTPPDAIDIAVEHLLAGARDFVPRPFHRRVLEARLRAHVGRTVELPAQGTVLVDSDAAALLRRLPETLLTELRETGRILPRRYRDVTLLRIEIAGFHSLCDSGEPLDTVTRLQRLTLAFEDAVDWHGLVILRHEGGAMLAAGGFAAAEHGPESVVRCALDVAERAREVVPSWPVRVAVHTGSVVAAVIGRHSTQLELWGASVQMAAWLATHGVAGAVTASADTWQRVQEAVTGKELEVRSSAGPVPIYRIDGAA